MTTKETEQARGRVQDKWLRVMGQATLAVVAISGIALSGYEFGQSTRTDVLSGQARFWDAGSATQWVHLPSEVMPRITLPGADLERMIKKPVRRSFGPYVAHSSDSDFDCLSQAVYYEARGEGRDGQVAVAQVVMNRAQDPRYPRTVCGVVFQGVNSGKACQFSFACDGSMARRKEHRAWRHAQNVARDVLAGRAYSEAVDRATHFHTTGVNPAWSRTLTRVARVGTHIFYSLPAHRGGYRIRQASLTTQEQALVQADTDAILAVSELPPAAAPVSDAPAAETAPVNAVVAPEATSAAPADPITLPAPTAALETDAQAS